MNAEKKSTAGRSRKTREKFESNGLEPWGFNWSLGTSATSAIALSAISFLLVAYPVRVCAYNNFTEYCAEKLFQPDRLPAAAAFFGIALILLLLPKSEAKRNRPR